nr:PREDICTED: uncharacterized protein KIAA1211-like homolog [Bos mutus]
MISTRVMDIKLREAAEGLGEDSTGKKKSKFKTFKKFFGKKKRKESSSSTGSSTWKQSQAKNEVMAIESGPVGYDSEDELEDSRGALGSRALSHDSIFIPESGQDPPRPVRVFSQENVCDRIKALQLKIQCNVKMGPPPPPGSLPTKRGDDAGMSSEDDGLPRSPPEMSLLHDIGSGTTIKASATSPEQASETSTSPRTSDSSMVPVADFDYPPEFSSCLDNSAAKHKLLVKPRNQRSSKMRRLSSRAQSESLSDLTCTPEEEEVDEKPPLQVSTEEQPSSGQQEAGQDRGSEPEGPAPVLPPAGPRVRRARLQHCPALTASMEEESPPGENPSSRPATPEGTLEATLEVMEVTEPLSGRTPHSESPSRPEGCAHPNPDSENQREDLSSESACPPGEDTADEAVSASGDNVEGRLSPCVPEGDTTPPEPGPAATPGTPPGPDGTDKAGQKEPLPTLDLPTPEGAGQESPAAAPSPPPPKSCLKHKAPSPPASEERAAGVEGGPFPVKLRSTSLSFKHREAPCSEGKAIKRYSAEVRLERGGLSLLSRDEKGPPGSGPSTRGARPPSEPGKAKTRPTEQLSSKPPLPRKPLLQTLTLPQLPAPPDTSSGDPEKVGLPMDPRKESRAERRSPHRAVGKRPGGAAWGGCVQRTGGDPVSWTVSLGIPKTVCICLSPPAAQCGDSPSAEPGGTPDPSAGVVPVSCRSPALATLKLQRLLQPHPCQQLPENINGFTSVCALEPVAGSQVTTMRCGSRAGFSLSEVKAGMCWLLLGELCGQTSGAKREQRARPASPICRQYPQLPPIGVTPCPQHVVKCGEFRFSPQKVAGPGTNSQPALPWVTVGRQKRRGPLEQPPSQEDKPAARTLKSDTGRPAKVPEKTQEPVKQADFVRSKSFLLAPAKPPADQRQGAKLRLQEGLQRGISLSHQNLAQSAVMMEKELHQLKRASYSSTDQPSWMELARKKSQAWSDMPQIIK